ncbi:MAG: adenosine kinase [Bacteroidetes bacterium HGW-Bacteroidetes-4]|jgi:sugar/nucleoside kinase (ribokinase family)|nr:MAG: adenosine kinase [Bacteroidetes bacterium HGW-Bacteroidetes-4]
MDKILGMGNALVDVMTKLNNDSTLTELNLPKGSMQLVDANFSKQVIESTHHLNQVMTSGGSAANTIHGLARLGIESGFVGKVGADPLGVFFKEDLEEAGIEPFLLLSETPTGKAVALVSPDSERTFATYLGAAVELCASDINPGIFEGYQYFHIEGYLVQNHELIETAVKIAKEKGLKVSLDLASYNVVEENKDFLHRIVRDFVDIIFANEEEARAFTGKNPEESLNELAKLCEYAVVKIGKQGSLIKHGTDEARVGIIGIDAFDTTGAGDLYAAGFLYGMVLNLSLSKCGKMGALLSGKVIENLGAKISEKGWAFIKEHLE